MYAVAFWLAWAMLPYLGRKRAFLLSRDQWTAIIAFGALGVVVGGRLGYVMLYDPQYFITNPLEIFKIWHGGMSSHGGFIGAALGVWLAARYFSPSYEGEREGVSILAIADILSVPAALGLALGRIGNITNGEFGLYPFYEAGADILIAAVCYVMLRSSSPLPFREREGVRGSRVAVTPLIRALHKGKANLLPKQEKGATARNGKIFASFLILYSIARFLLEYVRPQEWSYIYGLTRGQAYTIPLLLSGVLLWIYAHKHRI